MLRLNNYLGFSEIMKNVGPDSNPVNVRLGDKLLSEAPKLEVLMNDPQKIEKLHEWIAGERARLEKNKTQE